MTLLVTLPWPLAGEYLPQHDTKAVDIRLDAILVLPHLGRHVSIRAGEPAPACMRGGACERRAAHAGGKPKVGNLGGQAVGATGEEQDVGALDVAVQHRLWAACVQVGKAARHVARERQLDVRLSHDDLGRLVEQLPKTAVVGKLHQHTDPLGMVEYNTNDSHDVVVLQLRERTKLGS